MDKYKDLAYSYYNKAINLLENNSITEAVEQLKKSVRIYAQDTDSLNLLGLCYYYKCDFQKAELLWNKSYKLKNEDNSAAEYLKLLKSEKFKAFLKQYNHSIELINREKYSSAAEILAKINKEWTEFLQPYLMLSLIHLQKGEYTEAQILLKDARELDYSNIKIKEYLIQLQSELNNSQKLQLSENNFKNKRASAQNEAKVFKKLALSSLVILLLLGVFSIYQQNNLQSYEEKMAAYSREIDNIEQKTENHGEELAEFSSERNRLTAEKQELNADLRQIIAYAEQGLFNKAINLYRANSYKEAELIFQNIYNRGSTDYLKRESLFFLANAELKLDNQIEAVKYFNKYAERYPGSNYHDEVLYKLIIIYNERGDKKEAKRYLKKLKNEAPQSIYNNQKVNNILE